MIGRLEPFCSGFLCTYVDKEGMMQGTDLDWFRRLRAATKHEITAAGGITTLDDIRALAALNIHSALGMAIYTGRLDLAELAAYNMTETTASGKQHRRRRHVVTAANVFDMGHQDRRLTMKILPAWL